MDKKESNSEIKNEQKKIKEKKTKIDNTEKTKKISNILFSIIIIFFVSVFIADVYSMIQFGDKYVLIGGLSVALVILFYLVCDGIFGIVKKVINDRNKKFESYMKSQKAIYVSNKNGFEMLENKLDVIEELITNTKDEIINNNKAIAKTIIKKNSEEVNDIKFVISNIELKVPVEDEKYNISFDMEKLRQDIVNSITGLNDECNEIKELISKNIENEFELLKESIENNKKNISNIDKMEAKNTEEEKNDFTELDNLTDLLGIELPEIEEPEIEEPKIEEPEIELPEIELPEIELPELEVPEVDLSDPNKQLSADEIAALFASMGN